MNDLDWKRATAWFYPPLIMAKIFYYIMLQLAYLPFWDMLNVSSITRAWNFCSVGFVVL